MLRGSRQLRRVRPSPIGRQRRRWPSRELEAAGAIVIGKTNLDQFATGLVGVRSPYGVPRNALAPTLIPGGSSSGSAVAVAAGIVDFSLGTDTAGSGRIPAGMNGIVGLKPSLGLLSSTGMVPACRTLDTISVFARSVALAVEVTAVAAGYDAADAYSRKLPVPVLGAAPPKLRVGVSPPEQRKFFGDEAARVAYEADLERAGGDGRGARRARLRAAARGGAAALRGAVGRRALCRDQGADREPIRRPSIRRRSRSSAARRG